MQADRVPLRATTPRRQPSPRARACHWGAAGLALLLVGCQLLGPDSEAQRRPQPEPGRLINRAAVATPVAQAGQPELTATVKRGTLRDTVVLTGQVVPARTAQLSFRTGGTVRAVHVRSGQIVRRGDPLVELVLDDATLRAAQAQASVAELAYQSQQARVDELKRGGTTATVEELRANVIKARAALIEAQLARDGGVGRPTNVELQLARLALDQANDDLAAAQAAARRAQDPQTAAEAALRAAQRRVEEATIKLNLARTNQSTDQTTRQRELERAQNEVDDAQQAVALARREAARAEQEAQRLPAERAQAVRVAERKVAEAALHLAQLRSNTPPRNGTPVPTPLPPALRAMELQIAQSTLEEANAELERARTAAERSEEDAAALRANAALAVRTAERRLAEATDRLQQLQTAAQAAQPGEVRLAELALEEANENLAQAQLAAQQAREAASLSASEAARALRAAERKVAEAALKYEQARASQEVAQAVNAASSEYPDLNVAAAQAALRAAEAKLQDALQGTSSEEALRREELRAALLLDEAIAARAAAQPVSVLTAPFDGTVTAVEVAPNQTIEARAPVVRLDDPDRLSVLAMAAETDVARLALDQVAEIAFPGVTTDLGLGTITEISGAASRQGDRVQFPVRVDLLRVPAAVRLGMTATVTVNAREREDALYIPASAVRTVGSRALVTRVLPDGKAEEVPVTVGGTYGTEVEIVAGLREGDVVAIYVQPTTPPVATRSGRQ